MKLIVENMEDTLRVLVKEEQEGAAKKMYIEGVFMETGPNKNGRFYDMNKVLMPEVNRYIEEKINRNCGLGELGHPPTFTVNPDRVAIMIKELRQQGDTSVYGKALVLDTPMGNIVRNLINEGVTLGVSSRGVGSLKKNSSTGLNEVQNDFKLATPADVVTDPSAPNAFVQGIMEGVDWLYRDGELVAVQAKHNIEKATRSRELTEQRKLQIFDNFLKNLI